jgi:hypothetical protein
MEKNYYCNGIWFKCYEDATDYVESMMHHDGRYRVIYTRAEIESQINHKQECGK